LAQFCGDGVVLGFDFDGKPIEGLVARILYFYSIVISKMPTIDEQRQFSSVRDVELSR
jgi:hypothetical protein